MDAKRFEHELRQAFDDFPRSELPREPFYAELLEAVGGLAQPNNLALLAAATSCLGEGESYVEIGSFKGASMIAAAYDKAADVVGIDDFSMGEGSRERLEENLRRFGCEGATILEGDAFALLRGGSLEGRRVGVYYYDGAHGYEDQLEGLRLVQPFLAERALLIVDDTDWEQVERAVDDYLAGQAQARELLRLDGKDKGQSWWWEGMRVLAWSGRELAF